MFLIKTCPSCNKKIRFPIDRGRIKVSCSCGYSFVADPDNPELFKNSAFDLKTGKKKKKHPVDSVLGFFSGLDSSRMKGDVITALLNFKYSLQNFKLLPAKDQQKLVLKIALIFFITALIIFLVIFFTRPPFDSVVVI